MTSITAIVKRFQEVKSHVQSITLSMKALQQVVQPVRIVAVSKTYPSDAILELYNSPEAHLHFGENYVHEIVQKSKELNNYQDIKWHFIGHLQSNKVNTLVEGVPNLWCVETVDREKIATALNRATQNMIEKKLRKDPLKIMIQVNTSHESQKSGCDEEKVVSLVKYIRDSCPSLEFIGLMTIGALAHSTSSQSNPDFDILIECRKKVSEDLNIDESSIELSMGMSSDYEDAIRKGSTNIRVGSLIFGPRQYV